MSAYDIPQNNGRGFLSYFNRGRQISMTIYVKWVSESDFIQKVDSLRKVCYTPNALLDWKRNGEVRRIKVSCTSFPQNFQHYNKDWISFDVSFTALDPFWYKLDNQSTSIFWQTGNFQEEITSDGTAESEIISYIIFQNTNTTQVKMKVWDEEIIVNHSFSDNDILKIDGEEKRVFVWNTEIDYDGIFPTLKQGTNFFNFTINGTFSADITILNKKNYI